jgi:hypothetical protein
MSLDYEGIDTYLETDIPIVTENIVSYFTHINRSPYEHLEGAMASLKSKLVRGTPFLEIHEEMNRLLSRPSNKLLEDLVVLMFKTRDVQGVGERLLFRHMFKALYASHPNLLFNIMDLIPKYGYWKDFFYLAITNLHLLQPAMAIAYNQLMMDERALQEGAQLSLLAKWIPKEGKSMGRFTKEFANYIYMNTDMSYSQKMSALRRRLVKLNAALKTVEILTCANRWDEIDPSRVPVIAAKKSRAAFLNETVPRKYSQPFLRYPQDEKRLICRVNFQNYNPGPSEVVVDEARYEAVRQRVRALFQTGQTGLNT